MVQLEIGYLTWRFGATCKWYFLIPPAIFTGGGGGVVRGLKKESGSSTCIHTSIELNIYVWIVNQEQRILFQLVPSLHHVPSCIPRMTEHIQFGINDDCVECFHWCLTWIGALLLNMPLWNCISKVWGSLQYNKICFCNGLVTMLSAPILLWTHIFHISASVFNVKLKAMEHVLNVYLPNIHYFAPTYHQDHTEELEIPCSIYRENIISWHENDLISHTIEFFRSDPFIEVATFANKEFKCKNRYITFYQFEIFAIKAAEKQRK